MDNVNCCSLCLHAGRVWKGDASWCPILAKGCINQTRTQRQCATILPSPVDSEVREKPLVKSPAVSHNLKDRSESSIVKVSSLVTSYATQVPAHDTHTYTHDTGLTTRFSTTPMIPLGSHIWAHDDCDPFAVNITCVRMTYLTPDSTVAPSCSMSCWNTRPLPGAHFERARD